jgi:integrase
MKLFQNSKGRFYASFADEKGRRRFLSLKTTNRDAAEEIAAGLVASELSKEREPIRKEVDRYLEEKSETRSPNWTRDCGHVLRKWADSMAERNCTCVQDVATSHLQSWFYEKARTCKVSSVASYLFWVKHFFCWCRDERRTILHNPADKVKVPRHTKAVRRNFLLLEDAQRLIDNCVDEQLRFALYCALHAGMRYGETIAARPEWFDLDRKLIHIQLSSDWQPKNGKPRTVPMTEEFHSFLELYGLRSPFMIAPEKLRAGRNRYRYDYIRRFERLTMKLGIDCTFHDLRRTFSSLKASAGVSIYKISRWSGHNVETAEKHYGHLIPCDDQIEIGIERRTPAPEVEAPAEAPHRQLTWEELRELVWSMPMTKAARKVRITDNGLRKWCTRCKVPLPPQGYWNLPPHRRPASPTLKKATAVMPGV